MPIMTLTIVNEEDGAFSYVLFKIKEKKKQCFSILQHSPITCIHLIVSVILMKALSKNLYLLFFLFYLSFPAFRVKFLYL